MHHTSLPSLTTAAGYTLRVSAATLMAIQRRPWLRPMMETVGFVSLLRLVAKHAIRHQRRATLLIRIAQLNQQLQSLNPKSKT